VPILNRVVLMSIYSLATLGTAAVVQLVDDSEPWKDALLDLGSTSSILECQR